MTFNLVNIVEAQSLPTNGPVIQRTIEDESSIPQPLATAPDKAAHGVVYGLVGVILIVLALGIAYGYWGKRKK